MIELLDRTERSPNNDKSTLQDSGRIFGAIVSDLGRRPFSTAEAHDTGKFTVQG